METFLFDNLRLVMSYLFSCFLYTSWIIGSHKIEKGKVVKVDLGLFLDIFTKKSIYFNTLIIYKLNQELLLFQDLTGVEYGYHFLCPCQVFLPGMLVMFLARYLAININIFRTKANTQVIG